MDDKTIHDAEASVSNKRQFPQLSHRHERRSAEDVNENDTMLSWASYLTNEWMATLPPGFHAQQWMVITVPKGHRCLIEHSTSQATTRIYDRSGKLKRTLPPCLFPFSHASHHGMSSLRELMQALRALFSMEPCWLDHLSLFHQELTLALETGSNVCRLDAIYLPEHRLYYVLDVFSWTSYPSLVDCDAETRFALMQQSLLQIQAIFDALIQKLGPLSNELQAGLASILTRFFPFVPARPVLLSPKAIADLQSLSLLADSHQTLRLSSSQHAHVWHSFFHSSPLFKEIDMDGYLFYPRYESLTSSTHALWLQHFMLNPFMRSSST